jgi:hypothetical protein
MKNNSATNRMGSWASRTPEQGPGRPQHPTVHYSAARERVANIRLEIQAQIDSAAAAGFDAREMLTIPAIRQALRGACGALGDLRLARALLTS